MHPVEPGFVIAEGLDDRLGEVDATTAVHVGPNSCRSTITCRKWSSQHCVAAGLRRRTFRAKCAWATPEIPTSSESKLAGIFPRTYGADEKRWRLHGK